MLGGRESHWLNQTMAIRNFRAIVLSFVLAGCTSAHEPIPRLRVINSGQVSIQKLTVLFPKDAINFGDISAGGTTEYREVPRGVYRYSAYQFQMSGETITQPVIDWVGEGPMVGTRFTYKVEIDPRVSFVRLVNVTKDE